jgi:MFS family permease
MPFRGIAKKIVNNQTNAPLSMFLLANAFVWYLCAFKFLQDAASLGGLDNSLLVIIAFNFLTFAFSAFLGTKLVEHFNKRKTLLKYWMLVGIFVSYLFAVANLADFASVMLLAGIIGVYFGLGMPTFAGYFAASTEPQNRAKFGGATVLLIVLSFAMISLVGVSETFLTSSILAIWLAVGFLFLSYFKPAEKVAEQKNRVSFRSVISNKTFILYIVPWLMFSLVNDLTMQINATHFTGLNFPGYYVVIENVIAGVFAIVCGFLADKKGRKRLALIGFALLGVGYASLGLFNENIFAAWFYVCADGIAWGAFTTLFLITLWGDIAQDKNSEKYYVLGVLPYLFSNLAGASIGNYVSQYLKNEGTVFSFASFFLFAATLPLFYAPETLSDRIIRNKDLSGYVSKALEKVKKENLKNQKHLQKKDVQENIITEEELEDSSPEDIEARRLAEKYY